MIFSTILFPRLKISFDLAQQSGAKIFTRVNRNGRHAGAAFDAEMRTFLPDLDASLRCEDSTQIFGFHLAFNYMRVPVYLSRCLDSLSKAESGSSISPSMWARDGAVGSILIAYGSREAADTRLALFGSALGGDFHPDSDVDMLVDFQPGHVPGLDFIKIERELSGLLQGRRVERVTPKPLSPRLRSQIFESAEALYVAV